MTGVREVPLKDGMSMKACMARESQADPEGGDVQDKGRGLQREPVQGSRRLVWPSRGKATWSSEGMMQRDVLGPKPRTQGHLFSSPSVASVISSPVMGSPESFSFQSEELFSWRKSEMILAPSKPRSLSDTF